MSDQEKKISETESEEIAKVESNTEGAKKAVKKSAPKKAAKKDNKKKGGAGHWFKEMKGEMKKIVWPTKERVVKNTVTVIAMSVVVGAFIWIFDGVAVMAVKTLISALH